MKSFIYIIFFCFTTIAGSEVPQGFFLDDWEPKSIYRPSFMEAVKPEGAAAVKVTVDFADTLTKVPRYIYGNNANCWCTIMIDQPVLIDNIINMDPHVIRYPGGNLSNSFFWDRSKNDEPDDIPENIDYWGGMNPDHWTMSVDSYYELLDMTGCDGIISVNYSYARYGLSEKPVEKAAHLAAEWIRYDNGHTRFWEIGNENYGNWQTGYEIDTSLNKDGQPKIISGDLYGDHCRVFIDSMKAAAAETGHEIFIGVVAFEDETSWDPVQSNWNEKMMPLVGDVADFYVVHNYFTPYQQNSTVETILNSYTLSQKFIGAVWKDLDETGFAPKPVALTEWNIFAVGSKQQVSHINSMHAVLVLGETIRDGYGMAARWDLANGWSDGNDHGTFSYGGEPGVNLFAPRPVFFHMTFFQYVFGDVMVQSSVEGSRDLVAFASSFQSGHAGLVLVNKGRENLIVEMNIGNYEYGERYFWYTLTGGDDNGDFSRQVFINDIGPEAEAGGPEDYFAIDAQSAVINGNIRVDVPALSVVYMLVEGNKKINPTFIGENIVLPENFISIYPNPARQSFTIHDNGFNYKQIEIYNILGRKVLETGRRGDLGQPEKLDVRLASGLYFVRLKSAVQIKTGKLVIF
ncbi:T9SS type A sorting domain-containing protein [candidate division KSB1 bacterium]|nr:T9SS type A sorting domain-containing protein [candidate division KSB1 bacterium]